MSDSRLNPNWIEATEKLKAVGQGEYSAPQALEALRLAFGLEEGLARTTEKAVLIKHVSDALHNMAFNIQRRPFDEELYEWCDIYRYVAIYIHKRGYERIAEHIRMLLDLLDQSVSFFRMHPLGEVLQRPDIVKVLRTMAELVEPVDRATITERSDLHPNRVLTALTILVRHDLVQGRNLGLHAKLNLTPRAYWHLDLAPEPCPPDRRVPTLKEAYRIRW